MPISALDTRKHVISLSKHIAQVEAIVNRYSESELSEDFWEIAKNASDFFGLCSLWSAQKKSKDIEYFLCKILNLRYVDSSFDRGDAKDRDGRHYEFKVSTTNDMALLNIRQLRLWQDVDYYICCYIDEFDISNSLCFKLDKSQMEYEVVAHGCCSHGTKQANSVNEHREYSLTIGRKQATRWKRLYWYQELYDLLQS